MGIRQTITNLLITYENKTKSQLLFKIFFKRFEQSSL